MNIFNYIENSSYKLAAYIGRNDTPEEVEMYEYSIFMIFSELFTTSIGVILSLIFGYFIPYLISHVTYVLLRIGAGGYHCETFRDCFITTNLMYIISAIIANFTQGFPLYMWFISLVGGIFVMPICPKPSINSPSRGYSEDIRFRKKYRNSLLFLITVSLMCCLYGSGLISTSISAGMLIVCFITSDFGENIMNFLWRYNKK